MGNRLLQGLGVAAIVLLGAGCKLGVKKVIEDNRADVQANLTRAQKIGAGLAAVPPVTKDGITLPADVVMVAVSRDDLPTATVVYAEDLPELSAPVEHGDRLAAATLLTECASLLTRGKHVSASNPNVFQNVVKNYLSKCKNLKYLFVLRTRKKEARAMSGDVLAYDLASGKLQGGFAIDVQSGGRTDKVTNTTTSTKTTGVGRRRRTTTTKTTSESSVNADESQLRSDLDDAIDDGIRKYVPTAKFIEYEYP